MKIGENNIHWVTVTCNNCGNNIKIRASEYRRQLKDKRGKVHFCNKVCQGQWLFNNYAVKYYANARKKYDYKKIWQKHLETGLKEREFSELLNIPRRSVSYILFKMRAKENISGENNNGD